MRLRRRWIVIAASCLAIACGESKDDKKSADKDDPDPPINGTGNLAITEPIKDAKIHAFTVDQGAELKELDVGNPPTDTDGGFEISVPSEDLNPDSDQSLIIMGAITIDVDHDEETLALDGHSTTFYLWSYVTKLDADFTSHVTVPSSLVYEIGIHQDDLTSPALKTYIETVQTILDRTENIKDIPVDDPQAIRLGSACEEIAAETDTLVSDVIIAMAKDWGDGTADGLVDGTDDVTIGETDTNLADYLSKISVAIAGEES